MAVPVNSAIAQAAAELRAEWNLKTADAIQLATALAHNATTFLTNDRDFRNFSGIQILRLRDLNVSRRKKSPGMAFPGPS